MENSTQIVSFVLTMYADVGNLVYLYFPLALLLYVSVILANTLLVVIICLDRTLHEPMYLFLCCLSINQIYGSTALMPCLMVQLLSETHDISKVYCFIQIFCLHSATGVEFGTLTVMSYDRYVCICQPLHYNSKITKRKVKVLIFVIWTVSFLSYSFLLWFTVRLKFCGNLVHKVVCDNHLVVELSCSPDRTMSYIQDLLFGLALTVGAPLCFIMFTYGKILCVCLKGSTETRLKAFETCSPHFISIINLILTCSYNITSEKFDMAFLPLELHVLLSMYGLIINPLVNPLIYGLQLSKIRNALKKLMLSL